MNKTRKSTCSLSMSIALTNAYYCCKKLFQKVDIKNEQKFVKLNVDCRCKDNDENTFNEKHKQSNCKHEDKQ